jgi:hypothetical protein
MSIASKAIYGIGTALVIMDCQGAGAKDASVEDRYMRDLKACVSTSDTREEVDACRLDVDIKYGVRRQ